MALCSSEPALISLGPLWHEDNPAVAGATAQAGDDRLVTDRLDEVLEQGAAFGFQHYEEIEAKRHNSIEIEGWLDSG